MIQNRWLDYIDDLREIPYMAYFNILRTMKANRFFILGRDEKIEVR